MTSTNLWQKMGHLYYSQGRYAEALTHYHRAQAIHKKTGNKAGEDEIEQIISQLYRAQERDRLMFFDYVRSLAKKLILTITPDHLNDFQDIADIFFERVVELGGRITLGPNSTPAFGFSGSEVEKPMQLLAATYLVTQFLLDELSPQEIAGPIGTAALQKRLQQGGEKMVRQQAKLKRQDARDFAMEYIRLINQDWNELQELIEAQQSHPLF
jgi:hypothetical protein